jgi:hypothetical protein
MGVLAETDIWRWVHDAIPSLVVLIVAAGVAFGIGLLLRYRRAKIQRQYQNRVEEERNSGSGT